MKYAVSSLLLVACSSSSPIDGGPIDAHQSFDAHQSVDAGPAIDAPVVAMDAPLTTDFCPATGPCYITPLGDSITFGQGSTDQSGYRNPLRMLAGNDGLMLDLVGTQTAADGQHEGHPGWIIQQIRDNIDMFIADGTASDGMQHTPDIILLMIGTNDTNRDTDLPNAPARLGDLMDRIAVDAPDALLVVAQIVPNGDSALDSTAVADFNAAIPGLVSARAAAGQHITMVDMHSALDTATDFTDTLHPNDSGYDKMAAVWYSVLQSLL